METTETPKRQFNETETKVRIRIAHMLRMLRNANKEGKIGNGLKPNAEYVALLKKYFDVERK